MFDIILTGGRVVDGTGNPWYRADVGIKDGRIAKIGELSLAQGQRTIDAKDLIVAPGFIDIHSHAELDLVYDPPAIPRVMQGITTSVVGTDGLSAAPVSSSWREGMETELLPPEVRFDWDWSTIGDYLQKLEKQGVGTNVATLVGHAAIRHVVMPTQDRPPTKDELDKIKVLLAEAMDQGAYGLSAAMFFPPSIYASVEELIELCRVAAAKGGAFTVYPRDTVYGLIDSLKEVIKIGFEAQTPVQLAEIRVGQKQNWGRVGEVLELIEQARAKGLDIAADTYPYIADAHLRLHRFTPPWAWEGGLQGFIQRLNDSKTRLRIKAETETQLAKRPLRWGWEEIILLGAKDRDRDKYEGKSLAEIGRLKGKDPLDTLLELVVEEEDSLTLGDQWGREEDLCAFLKYPNMAVETDGGAGSKPHPRLYGTYPRFLGKYVREERVLTLEDAIRKTTSLPAQRMGFRDRGMLREGMWADITVFNPSRVSDRATFAYPRQYPEGIEYVLVNGRVVVEKGEHKGILAGHVLRRSG